MSQHIPKSRLTPPANDNGLIVTFEEDIPKEITPSEIEVFLHFASDLIAELDSANDNYPKW